MLVNNKLTKKLYRRFVLRDLFLGSKSSIVIVLLYAMLWRVLHTITRIGQLKTNIPLFLGISFLLLLILLYLFFAYHKFMKNYYLFQPDSLIEVNETKSIITISTSTTPIVFPLEQLLKIKENKKWYFLYFQDKTLIPISKENRHSLRNYFAGFKPIRSTFWIWTVIVFLLITVVGMYNVGYNAVNFNGALSWKFNEWKTDTKIKLENDNFYEIKLSGIMNTVDEKMDLEPNLMTNDLEIEFEKDGTITSIDTYIYGFDQKNQLQSGYLIYYDKTKNRKVTVHKQDWDGEGTTVYNPENDLSIVIKMLESIPVKKEVLTWDEETNAVLYKGIRSWGYSLEGIHFMDRTGDMYIPSTVSSGILGPTISLYVPGKEGFITPKRYVFEQ